MTVQGLIKSVSFDEIAAALQHIMTDLNDSGAHLTIIVWSSEPYPLTLDERKELQEFLSGFLQLPASSMQIVFGLTNAENTELQIQFISIRN